MFCSGSFDCCYHLHPMSKISWTCSVLPEDEWFTDVAQIAIEVLSGKEPGENDNDGTRSPVAPQSVECN